MNPSIFKAYDIRGKYPDEIDEKTVYQVARHFVEMMQVKEVVVAYDARVSAPSLLPHLYQGIADGGAKIIELGMTGTEVFYFAVAHFKYKAGIMLTASHNPKIYNGLKLVGENAEALSEVGRLTELRDRVLNSTFERINSEITKETINAYPEFRNRIFSLVNFDSQRKLKIVVDPGNGVGGLVFDKIFGDNKNLEIHRMYYEPDGNFPNHESNPTKIENVHDLISKVKELNADLGIALDGDADRVFFIDEKGGYSLGYFITALIAERVLEKYPKANIVHEARYDWAIIDTIKEVGGTGLVSKSGYPFIKALMRKTNAVFGGETSAHYYYRDTYNSDSPTLTIALILELMLHSGKSFSEILKKYEDNYFISGEINLTVENADVAMERVKTKYSEMEGVTLSELDGVLFEKGREWHISVRKSNTEPLIRLNVEANSPKEVQRVLSEVQGLIY